nr:crosslink repair DNA glycosylase YcaQ family protein [Sulfobacillus harzensis]
MTVSRSAGARFLLNQLQLGVARPSRRLTLAQRIRQLEAVQIDPVARVGRNQDLALMARAPGYEPSDLDDLLAAGQVFEYRAQEASVLPMDDYPLFEGVRQRLRLRLKEELTRHQEVVREVLDRIEREGALMARDFATDRRVLGYWDSDQARTKATSHVLNLLYDAGCLVIAGRQGVTRRFDLPERRVPAPLLDQARAIDAEEADRLLFDKYFRAYALVNSKSGRLGWSGRPMAWRRERLKQLEDAGQIVRVTIEGVDRPYFLRSESLMELEQWQAGERGWHRSVRFLPPLDNLLWDRDRLTDLFSFYYRWEVYVPPQRRTFGVYAMPILIGDRLVGRMDPELERATASLVIHNWAWEPGTRVTPRLSHDVTRALEAWAKRLGANGVRRV